MLKVISRSAFDLPAVLSTLVESAGKLCNADKATITREINGVLYRAESYGFSEEFMAQVRHLPVVPERGSISGRVMLEGKAVHVEDVAADPEYWPTNFVKPGELRTGLGIPMMRNETIIGVFALMRTEVRPFNEKQIELVQTFADQAVIAIENARLFEEVQARTRDLSEALQQQTATADVLKVISRSAFDLRAVLDTLASSAAGLIGANFAVMYLKRGASIVPEATFGCPPELVDFLLNNPQKPGRETIAGRVFLHGQVQTIPDVLADEEYSYGDAPRLGNFRALLGAPLFRDGNVEGSFTLGRSQPGPFTQRQIELVQTFADQAVIAIENVRLFNEVQAKTRDLSEALQQQTATADVLKVISRSAFDLQAVFDTLIASAVDLCGAHSGLICVRDGEVFRYRGRAGANDNEALAQYLADHPATPGRGTIVGRVLLSGKVEAIPDRRNDPDFVVPLDSFGDAALSLVGVPLLRDDRIEGALVLTRTEPGHLPARQIEILQTFADQAVIAIENMRLFDEVQARTKDLQEALQQQTATADVLKVISRSAFDLQMVFDTLLSSAVSLAGAAAGSMCVRDGSAFPYRATSGLSPDLVRHLTAHPAAPGPGSTADRVLLSGEVVSIADVLEDPDYVLPTMQLGTPMRSTLGVPLLRDDRVEGALVLVRLEPGTFHRRQIDLVKTFADQAVIAIENVRLFDEVQARTKELAASLDDLRKAQDRLIQSEKLASLGQLTAGIAHEIKNPLNFVNNFSALSRELMEELREVLEKARARRRGPRRGARADRHDRRQSRQGRRPRQARRIRS